KLNISEIDFQRIRFERFHNHNFNECACVYGDRAFVQHIQTEPFRLIDHTDKLKRKYEKNPFVPAASSEVNERCSEIFDIQATGLMKRIEHSRSKKSIIGISGGLDSTLALLVVAAAHKLLGKPTQDIIAITMPGFGTTGKTYNNALTIMKLLGADVREISIKNSVLQHFDDIGQKEENHDITYENSQARERTQILMDIANMEGGFVVGTGDLSEMALGWCTYNGDHISMYGVNCGVPKTLVKFVVKWVMEHKLSGPNEDINFSSNNKLLAKTLQAILDTPISPELLPPTENGEITQITEDNVGPYELHDFFIYYTIRYGMTPNKLLFAAKAAFAGQYDEDFIIKWETVFYKRFFSQQFKRNCVPDGPKVGSVSLSPRGDWRMPSDSDPEEWLK
ncbi:MAG: NAD(+) synthase, partial [Bacteroidaceae bacterium]